MQTALESFEHPFPSLALVPGGGSELPPMLKSYCEYKALYPDSVIFFQVGDFYEVFFEDAVLVARTLNITLTSRDKNSDAPIPMCGVPIAVIETYLARLVEAGLSAAVISQVGEVGPKGVDRRLERIVTPGIRILSNDDSRESPVVLAIAVDEDGRECDLAWTSVQDGTLVCRERVAIAEIIRRVLAVGPSEIVLSRSVQGREVTRRLAWVRDLERRFGESAIKFRMPGKGGTEEADLLPEVRALSGYALLQHGGRQSLKLLLSYIEEVTVQRSLHWSEIRMASDQGVVRIDPVSREHLELIRGERSGGLDGSLLGYLNETQTAGGFRLLRNWILEPLARIEEISRRQDAIEKFLSHLPARAALQERLRLLPDMERIATRIELDVVSPKELGALRDALEKFADMAGVARGCDAGTLGEDICAALHGGEELLHDLQKSLHDSPPAKLDEGGIIREGYSEELDSLRELSGEGKTWVLELEEGERRRTGITSLKVRSNGMIGYYIEITKTHLEKVPSDYIRRQTMVNGARFTTPELAEKAKELFGAEDKALRLEHELFAQIREQAKDHVAFLRKAHGGLSLLDVLLALARVAEREGLVRPLLVQEPVLLIQAGKHPLLARSLRGAYIPNDVDMSAADPGRILTGANMGGKSTYLRQIALTTLLAHMGSFVPAQSAQIGLVDCIFARLGSADDIAEGDSTFMVEMRETAAILHEASRQSLVLIDEIGRGTSTRDGRAIAQAVLEHFTQVLRCRLVFATHFHGLTALADEFSGLENISAATVERDGRLVFTHEIRRGPASHSYGIEVARRAGLPESLLARAEELMASASQEEAQLHHGEYKNGSSEKINSEKINAEQISGRQLSFLPPLTEARQKANEKERNDNRIRELVCDEIYACDPNTTTPLQALEKLSSWKERLRSRG